MSEETRRTPEAILHRLEWTVLRRLDGLIQGNYRSLFRGAGLDLADLREYQYHDDVRHIDWNVTARLQTPYVREFHEDRETSVWFLLDLSPSMDFGSGETSKRLRVTELLGLLGRLFQRQSNPIGALIYGGQVDHIIRPGNSRRHLLGLMSRVLGYPAPATGPGTRLSELLEVAGGAIRRRSIVIIVSDFISEPGWSTALGRLASRHAVTAVRVLDPYELTLPDIGLLTIQDAETGEQLFIDTHDRRFRRRYEAQVEAREQALQTAWRKAGVDVLEVLTDDDLLEALMRLAAMRSGRAAHVAGAPADERLATP
ncbi:MAG: DUF58 domain-containing protein [Burkholderiaceae bacterium]